MFDRTLNATLPNNVLHTARRKSEEKLSTAGITTQRHLGLSLSLNSLDLHQNNKIKSCIDPAFSFSWVTPKTETLEQLWKHFTFLKLCHYFQIPQGPPKVTSIFNRTKTTTIGLIIYKQFTRTKWHYLAHGTIERELSHPKEILESPPSLIPLITQKDEILHLRSVLNFVQLHQEQREKV